MSRLFADEKGFSVVESMTAVAITGIAAMIAMDIAAQGYVKTAALRDRLQSRLSASYVADSLFFAEPGDPRLTAGQHSVQCSLYACPVLNGPLQAKWTVTPDVPAVGTARIDIVVEWKEANRTHQSHSVVYRRIP